MTALVGNDRSRRVVLPLFKKMTNETNLQLRVCRFPSFPGIKLLAFVNSKYAELKSLLMLSGLINIVIFNGH